MTEEKTIESTEQELVEEFLMFEDTFDKFGYLIDLGKSLKPLEPTREDLAGCLERCQTLGLKIGKVAKLDEVWQPLERQMAGFNA